MLKIKVRLLATTTSLLLPFFLVYALRTAAASPMNYCSVPGDFSTIQTAVDNPGCNTINVGGGTIIEQVVITRTVSIVGRGADATIVQGGAGFRAIQIRSGGIVTLTGMTISGGSAVFGGGLLNDFGGMVTINDCVISGNSSTYSGGGIANRSVMTISNSTISDNTADSLGGGGISVAMSGTLTINNSIVSNNFAPGSNGGGISLSSGGEATIISSTLSSNEASNGGAMVVYGRLLLQNSLVYSNSAEVRAGGIYVRSEAVTITNSTLSQNAAGSGGAILVELGSITILNSTLSANSAGNGGAIMLNFGGLTLDNSTLSGNVATGSGGAILMHGSHGTARNSTLAENIGGTGNSVYLYDNSALTVTNSILGNSVPGDDCSGEGSMISAGYNLDSDGSCNLTAVGDLPAKNPHLGSLTDHGGATFTHAFLPGSPAVDAGYCPGVAVDQRGFLRPVDMPNIVNVADECDIGAFEAADFEEYWTYLPVVTR